MSYDTKRQKKKNSKARLDIRLQVKGIYASYPLKCRCSWFLGCELIPFLIFFSGKKNGRWRQKVERPLKNTVI